MFKISWLYVKIGIISTAPSRYYYVIKYEINWTLTAIIWRFQPNEHCSSYITLSSLVGGRGSESFNLRWERGVFRTKFTECTKRRVTQQFRVIDVQRLIGPTPISYMSIWPLLFRLKRLLVSLFCQVHGLLNLRLLTTWS